MIHGNYAGNVGLRSHMEEEGWAAMGRREEFSLSVAIIQYGTGQDDESAHAEQSHECVNLQPPCVRSETLFLHTLLL